MAKKKKRGRYDRDAIEKVYRTGMFTDRQIAAQFGCSHTMVWKWVKKYGWLKDLSQQVRQRVKSKLVAKVALEATESEMVETAATIGAQVVELHRKDINALREVEAKLIEELNGTPKKLYITQYQGDIVSQEVGLTVAERAAAANNLANVQAKRIALERQAFNLDATEESPDGTIIHVHTHVPEPSPLPDEFAEGGD